MGRFLRTMFNGCTAYEHVDAGSRGELEVLCMIHRGLISRCRPKHLPDDHDNRDLIYKLV